MRIIFKCKGKDLVKTLKKELAHTKKLVLKNK